MKYIYVNDSLNRYANLILNISKYFEVKYICWEKMLTFFKENLLTRTIGIIIFGEIIFILEKM